MWKRDYQFYSIELIVFELKIVTNDQINKQSVRNHKFRKLTEKLQVNWNLKE